MSLISWSRNYITYMGPLQGYITDSNLFNKILVGIYQSNMTGNKLVVLLAESIEIFCLRDYLELPYDVQLKSGPYPGI